MVTNQSTVISPQSTVINYFFRFAAQYRVGSADGLVRQACAAPQVACRTLLSLARGRVNVRTAHNFPGTIMTAANGRGLQSPGSVPSALLGCSPLFNPRAAGSFAPRNNFQPVARRHPLHAVPCPRRVLGVHPVMMMLGRATAIPAHALFFRGGMGGIKKA